MSDYYISIPHDDYVIHHGVLGQKWGVRRYQNADGTLTAEGKRLKKQYNDNSKYFSYRVGAKRLARRVNKYDKKATKLASSMSTKKLDKSRVYKQYANDFAGMLSSPKEVKRIGSMTVAGRIANSSAAAAATFISGILAGPAGAAIVGGASGAILARNMKRLSE